MAKTPDWLSRAVKEGRVYGRIEVSAEAPGCPRCQRTYDLSLVLGLSRHSRSQRGCWVKVKRSSPLGTLKLPPSPF